MVIGRYCRKICMMLVKLKFLSRAENYFEWRIFCWRVNRCVYGKSDSWQDIIPLFAFLNVPYIQKGKQWDNSLSASVQCVISHAPRQWWIMLGVKFCLISSSLHTSLVQFEINSLPLSEIIVLHTPNWQNKSNIACDTVMTSQFDNGTLYTNLLNMSIVENMHSCALCDIGNGPSRSIFHTWNGSDGVLYEIMPDFVWAWVIFLVWQSWHDWTYSLTIDGSLSK